MFKKCKNENCTFETNNPKMYFPKDDTNKDGMHDWCRICINEKNRKKFKIKDRCCPGCDLKHKNNYDKFYFSKGTYSTSCKKCISDYQKIRYAAGKNYIHKKVKKIKNIDRIRLLFKRWCNGEKIFSSN